MWQKYTALIASDGALTETLLRKSLKLRQDAGLYTYTSEVLYFRHISITLTFWKFQEECTAGEGTCVAVRSVLSRWLFQTCVTHDCSTIHYVNLIFNQSKSFTLRFVLVYMSTLRFSMFITISYHSTGPPNTRVELTVQNCCNSRGAH